MGYDILKGVRVVEVAAYWFVPSAGAILAEWGAEVIKVESALVPDPMRGMRYGLDFVGPIGNDLPEGRRNAMFEQSNRGKRGMAVDLSTEGGREVVYELVRHSDVFLTSFLPGDRRKFGIDVDDIRKINNDIIYARGTGQGTKGPDAERGGVDSTSFWFQGGVAYLHRASEDMDPPLSPVAYGDSFGGMTLAAGISAALYRRATVGEASVVDVSLLGSATWLISPDIIGSKLSGQPRILLGTSHRQANPIARSYRTMDGDWFRLAMFNIGRWADLITNLGRPDLAVDQRFADTLAMEANYEFAVEVLTEIFENATTDEMKARLANIKGTWGVMQSPLDVHEDPQVQANGFIDYSKLEDGSEVEFPSVPAPVQFDERPARIDQMAPLHNEHTEEVLQDLLGWDMDKIIELKIAGAVM